MAWCACSVAPSEGRHHLETNAYALVNTRISLHNYCEIITNYSEMHNYNTTNQLPKFKTS